MFKLLIAFTTFWSFLSPVQVQSSDLCDRDTVIASFAEADDLRTWASEYAASDCPQSVKRAVNALVAASDLMASEFLIFASGSDAASLSPIWKWYQGRSSSWLYNIDVVNNMLTLIADTNTEQQGEVTTAPVLAYEYEGDFTAQVLLDFSPLSDKHGAGFGIRAPADLTQWVRITWVGANLELTVNDGENNSTRTTLSYLDEQQVYLEIARNRSIISVSYSVNGDDWSLIEEIQGVALPDRIEIYLTTFWAEERGAGVARFSKFSVQ